MKSANLSVVISSLGLAALVSVSAQAADCGGYDVLVNQTVETTELGEGHSVTQLKAYSVMVTNDPTNIYHLTMGFCFGTMESFPDGSVKMAGNCARKDKEGDTYNLSWSQEPGAERGTWQSGDGTGKFAGLSDGGWFQNAGAEGDMFASAFDGACGK